MIIDKLWNKIRGKTRWSKARRLFSYIILLLSAVLFCEAIFDQLFGGRIFVNVFGSVLLIAFSVVYFSIVIVGVIFLTGENFQPNPVRLAADTMISIIFCVLSFSTIYHLKGISLGAGCEVVGTAMDQIYFSAVTFSTLGYGDFRPCEATRLFASFQAIFGNLHLGLIVGSAFFVAQTNGNKT